MPPPYSYHRTSLGTLGLTLLSCLACIYVGGRLWATNHELYYVREELRTLSNPRGTKVQGFPILDTPTEHKRVKDDVLFYSVRTQAGPGVVLKGDRIENDIAIQPRDDKLLGQIDGLEAGVVTGWACMRGQLGKPLEVLLYVDGVKVGEALAKEETPHHIVHRLCELDLHFASDMEQPALQQGVGFEFNLPNVSQGRHEIRAFVRNFTSTGKQELNQSPLPFIESRVEPALWRSMAEDQHTWTKTPAEEIHSRKLAGKLPSQWPWVAAGLEEALKRKDGIIRVRNAQIAALWDELHTRQPWRNALEAAAGVALPGDPALNSSRALVVFGINTGERLVANAQGIGARERRDTLRRSWAPTGKQMHELEARGIYIRFVIGYSEQKDDRDESQLQQEMKAFGDIVRLDIVDSYADLSGKTLKMFAVLPQKIDADFYFKVDDDVAVNVDALEHYLLAQRNQGNLYMGCMKSGQVLTDRRYKWFEPEYWRFGDPAGEGGINYMRHASGQIYGLSGPIAKYIGRNMAILHRYANEDVSVGSWLVGLDVTHIDERRFCCDSAEKCQAQSNEGNLCLSYYEHQCAGICSSESRLEGIWKSCLDKPLEKRAEEKPLMTTQDHRWKSRKNGETT